MQRWMPLFLLLSSCASKLDRDIKYNGLMACTLVENEGFGCAVLGEHNGKTSFERITCVRFEIADTPEGVHTAFNCIYRD